MMGVAINVGPMTDREFKVAKAIPTSEVMSVRVFVMGSLHGGSR